MQVPCISEEVISVGVPAVSIIVPVYNGERFLRICIDSILAQTFADFELILVNDGSSDRSADILAEYEKADARVRVVTQKNQGVSAARNAGLDVCRGEFVRFIDCDDTLPPDSLDVLVKKARGNGSDLVIAAYHEVVGKSAMLRDLPKSEETMPCNDFLKHFSRYPTSFYYGVLWNKLFRRELIANAHLRFTPGMTWGEDFTFVAQYLVYVERVSYTGASVYNYLRNPDGLTFAMISHVIKHPCRSMEFRLHMYRMYRILFQRRGLYEQYRHKLWRFMISFTISK